MLLVLQRGSQGFTRWASLEDPGWDVRSIHLRATPGRDLAALRAGKGWRWLEAGTWVPPRSSASAVRPLAEVAAVRQQSVRPKDLDGPVDLAELADGDRKTGELHPQRVPTDGIKGPRLALSEGDVLVARMRPSLGNVVVAPASERPLLGSPEWIPLQVSEAPHWVLHALRTPAWRASLPLTRGQTRPRTHAEGVLGTDLPWPGQQTAARVDALSRSLHAERARLRERLVALQALVDRFAEGELDGEQLDAAVAALEDDAG